MDQVRDDLEREIIASGYLEGAPFTWVGLIIREGLVDGIVPCYERINAKHGDLPVAIEIDTHQLIGSSLSQAVAVYRRAALIALIHAGEKYSLEIERLRQLLNDAGQVR